MSIFLEEYADRELSLVVEFGDGDVGILGGKNSDDDGGGLAFFNVERGEVGRKINTYPTSSQNIVDLRFRNVESINVVIESLIKVRDFTFFNTNGESDAPSQD